MDAVKIGLFIDLGLILFFVINLIIGRVKGMVKILRGFLVPILAILLAYSLNGMVSTAVQERDFFDKIEVKVDQMIDEKLPTIGDGAFQLSDYDRANMIALMNQFGVDQETQEQILNQVDISPKEALAEMIDHAIAKAIAYVVVFVGAVLVLSILFFFLGLIFKNALLRPADKLFGMIVGGLRGVVIVMILIYVLQKLNVVLFAVFPELGDYLANSRITTFLSRALQWIL